LPLGIGRQGGNCGRKSMLLVPEMQHAIAVTSLMWFVSFFIVRSLVVKID
jgi:hypothetical protein